MPPIRPIQPAFNSGEFSPNLYSRVDIDKYRSGLRRAKNFFVHPFGGASNRPGTRFIAYQGDQTRKARVVRFIFSTLQAYVLEFGHEYIKFFRDQEPVLKEDAAAWSGATSYVIGDFVTHIVSTAVYYAIQDGTNQNPSTETDYWRLQSAYQIVSPYQEDDLPDLKFESSGDVIYITHPDYQQRELARYADDDWRIELFDFHDGPFMLENVDASITLSVSSTTGSATLSSTAAVFSEQHVGALFRLVHAVEGQADSSSFGSTGTGTGIRCFTTWRIITHGTWTGKFRIEKSDDNGATWTVLRSFSSANDFNANTFGTESIDLNPEAFLVRINMYSYTSGTMNYDLTTDPFIQEGIVKITDYNSSVSVDVDIMRDVADTTGTVNWAEGSWSNYRGWPAESRFYQDRLCFASTYAETNNIWMSETGIYNSFRRHQELLDTDAINVRIPSREVNAINGMIAFKNLIIFTSASEWSIGPVSGSVVTPTKIETKVEGYRGSFGLAPVIIGNEGIFIQANGKIVRSLGYDFSSDSFDSSYMNIMSSHLFDKHSIIDMAYQQDPDSLLWCLRDDGVLLSMTYVKDQDVAAWTWHSTGGGPNEKGIIESICVIPGQGYDELWMTVKRGDDKRFIEVLTQRTIVYVDPCTFEKSIRVEDQYFVDAGVIFSNPQVTITGVESGSTTRIIAPAHDLSDGDIIKIYNLPEFPSIENKKYTVSDVSGDSFIITAGA